MGFKWLLGVAGMVVATSLVACMAAPSEDLGDGRGAASTGEEFNKNNVLTDTVLRDTEAMSVADIQKFLEKTPGGKKSVLAEYTEDGKTAAEIMAAAAAKYRINPLELLVRVQMEQGLVEKTTASEESIEIAFGCGCPHSPVCGPKYMGFANQAECAAGTLSRSMDRSLTEQGTVSGWKKGEEKSTEDRIEVTPSNAATAALYTYTPWVGEAGGGRRGVGGASLHFLVWNRFADAVSYGVAAPTADRPAETTTNDAGAPAEEEEETPPEEEADAGSTTPTPTPPPTGTDAGTTPPRTDAGADEPVDSDTTEGSDDDDILGEGNAPPANNAPAPRGSSSSRSSSSDDDDRDESEASEADLATKKKAQDGCSTTGSNGSSGNAALIGLAVVAVSLAGKRRRQG